MVDGDLARHKTFIMSDCSPSPAAIILGSRANGAKLAPAGKMFQEGKL
jgi:hypothetical protein